MRATTKKSSRGRRSSSLLSAGSSSMADEEEPKPQELYREDLQTLVSKVLENSKSERQLAGENVKLQGDTLSVDISGFYAHLIKIAWIWSNG